ncbi:MAG: sugar phosphate isomerase/epimerase family protein [Candidatus Njordarchaeia archaeon]
MDIFVEPFLFNVRDSIEIAKKHGLGLELLVTPERYSELELKSVSMELRRLKKLSIHGPIYDITPGAVDPLAIELTRRRYEETLKFATKFEAEWALFHLAFNPLEFWHPITQKKWIERATNFFNLYFPETGIKIHLENSFEKEPEIFLKVLDGISNNEIFVCLDVGHVSAYSNRPVSEWIDKLSPYIKEVHLHNNDGKYDQHWRLDKGVIDIEKVLKNLEDKVGDFYLTLEPIDASDLERNLQILKELSYL